MKKVYKSKIGLEVVIPISLILTVIFILAIMKDPSGIGVAIILTLILFFVYMFRTTSYAIENEVLTVKSGFLINKTIDIKTIKKINICTFNSTNSKT
jgi:uncharacterized membrane protein YdbT with pleckstrin-like domain